MDSKIREILEKWVTNNYKQKTTGYTYERSYGDCAKCFDDGEQYGTSLAAYEVGCILGMDLELPEDPIQDEWY